MLAGVLRSQALQVPCRRGLQIVPARMSPRLFSEMECLRASPTTAQSLPLPRRPSAREGHASATAAALAAVVTAAAAAAAASVCEAAADDGDKGADKGDADRGGTSKPLTLQQARSFLAGRLSVPRRRFGRVVPSVRLEHDQQADGVGRDFLLSFELPQRSDWLR